MEKGKQTYKLPEGWIWTSINEVVHFQKGKKPRNIDTVNFKDSVPYLDIKAFEHKRIERFADSESAIIVDENDIVMVWDGARSGWVSEGMKGALGSTLAKLKPFVISSKYLYYYLNSQFLFINSNAKGTGIPHVDPVVLWRLGMPLPPLQEQDRIVSKIESIYSEHDDAKKEFQKAKYQLEIYKHALLKNAFNGKLTENWRQGKSSKISQSKHLLPIDWKYTKIENISSFIGSGSTPRGGRNIYQEEGIPFIRSQNIYPNTLIQDDLVFISESIDLKMKRTQTQPKDVLLNITGASIGRCAYIPENFKEGNVNQHVCIIRTIPEHINYKYLTYLLNSPEIQSLIKRINSGATREALNLTQIRNIEIPICNIQEQEQIVFHLDSKFTLIKNLEDSINKELLNLEKLKHSILNEAFNGKLVPQIENEESALNLLNQIKTEKTLYLKKFKSDKMNTSSKFKSSIKKKTLLAILREEYSDNEFSFEDIRKLSNLTYEDLKTELYLLLDKNKELEIVFDKSVKKILYRIKL